MHSTITYEQITSRDAADIDENRAGSIGTRFMNWLGRIGERSAMARQARAYQHLNALEDAQLARMNLKRSDLVERCFGWRAYY